MRKALFIFCLALSAVFSAFPQSASHPVLDFGVKGFHLDLRIQVMTMDALKKLATQLHEKGLNTLIMEWEGSCLYKRRDQVLYLFLWHPGNRCHPASTELRTCRIHSAKL